MKKCPCCNGKYDDNVKKCSSCGIALVDCSDTARRCKRCGRELGEDEIVCRSCEKEKALKIPILKEDIQNTGESSEAGNSGYPHQDKVSHSSKEKITPKSLEGLSSLSFLFRLVDVFFTLLGLAAGFMYYKSTDDMFIAIIIGVAVISLGFFYMMISTLFQALHDIVRGIYHIANK